MAKTISGLSTPKSAMAMAILAIPVEHSGALNLPQCLLLQLATISTNLQHLTANTMFKKLTDL